MSLESDVNELLRSKERDPRAIEDGILRVAKWQAEVNPAYSFFLKSVGEDPESWEKWSDVRPMPVRLYKEMDVYSGKDKPEEVWHSSGTTSDKASVTKLASRDQYNLAINEGYRWLRDVSVFRPDIDHVSLIPSGHDWPHSSLAYMFDELFGAPDFSFVNNVTEDSFKLDMTTILESKGSTIFIYGTSYAFVKMMDFLKDAGYKDFLNPNSVILDTGGYKNKSRNLTREQFVELAGYVLGIHPENCITEYGMSELSSQFWASGTSMYEPSPFIRTRVINPETGEDDPNGVLAIYDLANIWTCAAIMTEDLVEREEDDPQSRIKILGRAQGAVAKGCSLVAERALS